MWGYGWRRNLTGNMLLLKVFTLIASNKWLLKNVHILNNKMEDAWMGIRRICIGIFQQVRRFTSISKCDTCKAYKHSTAPPCGLIQLLFALFWLQTWSRLFLGCYVSSSLCKISDSLAVSIIGSVRVQFLDVYPFIGDSRVRVNSR